MEDINNVSDVNNISDANNITFEDKEIKSLNEVLKDMYLTFAVEDEEYGVEVKHITEIIGIQKIAKLPQVENYIKGIINLRGSIIPVLDIRLKFGKPEKEYDSLTCIVVLEYGNMHLGAIVDSVSEVISISEVNILPPPSAKHGYRNQYIKNIGKVGDEVKLILDLDRLLATDEIM